MDNSRPTNQTYYGLFQQDPRGQAVLEELSRLFYDSQQFSKDPYEHAYNAGKREVISYLLKRCAVIEPTETNDE